jgi:hypothetical protein
MTTPEFEILHHTVRLDNKTDAIMQASVIIESEPVDWDDLLLRAELHHIRPQLESLLSKISSPKIPDHVRTVLRDFNRENLLRQLRNLAEFFQVTEALKERVISAIPFKGFWLAHVMYGNLADRESCDIDMFIRLHDLEGIREVMLMKGYQVESFFSPFTLEEIKKRFGEYNFEKIEDGIKNYHLEFQWGISGAVYGLCIRYDELASKVITGRIEDRELSVFNPSANLLLAVMHHGGKDPLIELKHVCDVAHIIMKYRDLEWDWIMGVAKGYRAEDLVYTAVRMASLLTGACIPEMIRNKVDSKRIRRLAEGRIRFMAQSPQQWERMWFKLNNWIFRIRSRTGIRIRARLALYIISTLLLPYLVPAGLKRRVKRREVKV